MKYAIYLIGILYPISIYANPNCHYDDKRWNIMQKQTRDFGTISKSFSTLTADERDPQSGCSVCREDQQVIHIDGMQEFLVCRRYANPITAVLHELRNQGARINSVIGYRVGRSRGRVDAQGNRTGFSNHSYGIAIDINTEHNGLYDHCITFGPACQLIRGGPWRPGVDPYSLQREGLIVRMFKQMGFKWGGEIAGKQKDFMHFSLTGY